MEPSENKIETTANNAQGAGAQGAMGNAQGQAQAPMPRLNIPGGKALLDRIRQQKAGVPEGQQMSSTDENPDAATAQEVFKDIKDGDTYTDANGKKWVWAVYEYDVVPEDTKDEIVDSLEVTEAPDGAEGSTQESMDAFNTVMEEGEDGEEKKGVRVVQDEAMKMILDAANEVLGITDEKIVVAEDAQYTAPRPLYVDPKRSPATQRAAIKAAEPHRKNVAATYAECKAKDPARCRYHGAAYMTDMLGRILRANGITGGKYGITMVDREVQHKEMGEKGNSYRLNFSVPEDTPLEVKNKIAKEFFASNENFIYEKNRDKDADYEGTIFSVKGMEDYQDAPADNPTEEEEDEQRLTIEETDTRQREERKNRLTWNTIGDAGAQMYFDMLSQRPKNIVAQANDTLRFAQQFSEMLPPDMKVKDVEKAYNDFMKANAKKKGLQAFITGGLLMDRGEFLAKAAEMGLAKEGKKYYDAAEKIYDIGATVSVYVRNGLWMRLKHVEKMTRNQPTIDEMNGRFGKIKYLGAKYSSRESLNFPDSEEVKGPLGDKLRTAVNEYVRCLTSARTNMDLIAEGCDTKEPLLVDKGINTMWVNAEKLQDILDRIGDTQDEIIARRPDMWLKKNGYKANTEEEIAKILESRKVKDFKDPHSIEEIEKFADEEGWDDNEEEEGEKVPEEVEGGAKGAPEEPAKGGAEPPEAEAEKKGGKTEKEEKKKPAAQKKGSKGEKKDRGESAAASETGETWLEEAKRLGTPFINSIVQSAIMQASKVDSGLWALNWAQSEAGKEYGLKSKEYKAARDAYWKGLLKFGFDYLEKHPELEQQAKAKAAKVAKPSSPTTPTNATPEAPRTGSTKAEEPQSVAEEPTKAPEIKFSAPDEKNLVKGNVARVKSSTGALLSGDIMGMDKDTVTIATKDSRGKQTNVTVPRGDVIGVREPSAEEVEARKSEESKSTPAAPASKREGTGNAPNKGSSVNRAAEYAATNGPGITLLKGIKLPDKPTEEEAIALNEKFAEIEKALRGMERVYNDDSQNWKVAESEMKAIKAGFEKLMKDAQGKGYNWSRDSIQGNDYGVIKRVLDVPKNFHINAITLPNGEKKEIKYKAPVSGAETKYIPPEVAPEGEKGEGGDTGGETGAKNGGAGGAKKPSAAAKVLTRFSDKAGEITGGKTLKNMLEGGYVLMPVPKGDQMLDLLVVPDKSSPTGVDMSQPRVTLQEIFTKRNLGKTEDQKAYERFLKAVRNYLEEIKNS